VTPTRRGNTPSWGMPATRCSGHTHSNICCLAWLCTMAFGHPMPNFTTFAVVWLGPFYGAIAVPSVTRCRCCCRRYRGHRCAGGVRQWRRATVATPGEWQCKIRRLAVANRPNIFQMLLVLLLFSLDACCDFLLTLGLGCSHTTKYDEQTFCWCNHCRVRVKRSWVSWCLSAWVLRAV